MDAGVKFVIDTDTKKLNAGLRSSEKEMNSLEKTSEETTKSVEGIEEAGNGLNALSLAGLTAALAVVGQAAKDVLIDVTNVAIEFDTGMRKVSTLLDENAKGSQDWGKAFKSAAIETGQSLTDVTDATYQAISAGIDHADSIDFVTSQNKLAIGGHTDLTSAIDVTTKTLNAYGLGAQDAAKINDILIATQNNGITTVDELSASLANVTPTAAAMGVTFDQVGAAMAVMTEQGTPTAQATTQLNTLLAELGKSGTTASTRFKELSGQTFQEFIAAGGNVGQAVGLMTKDLSVAGEEIQRLVDSGLEYDDAFEQVVSSSADTEKGMIDMFGSVEAAKAAMQLASENGEVFAGKMDAMANSAGNTEQAFLDMTKGSPEYALAQMNSASEVLKATLGEQLLPAITPIIEAFGKLVAKISESEKLSKLFVAILITLTVTFTILSVAIGIMAIQAFLASIAVNAMLWPILIVAVAIGAFIAIVILCGEQVSAVWEWIKEKTIAFAKSVKKTIITAWEFIKDNWQTILMLILTITFGIFGLILGIIIKNKDKIIETIKLMWEKVKQLFEKAKEVAIMIITTMWDKIKQLFTIGKDFIVSIITNIKNVMETIFNAIKQIVTTVINTMWASVKLQFEIGKKTLTTIVTVLWNTVKILFEIGKNLVVSIVTNLWNAIKNIFTIGKNIVVKIVQTYFNLVKNIFNTMKSTLVSIVTTLWNIIKNLFTTGKNVVVGIVQVYFNAVKKIFNAMKTAIVSIVNALWNSVKAGFDLGKQKVVNIVNAMKSGVLNAFNSMKNGISSIINGIISSLTKFVNKVISVKNTVVGAFKNMISGVSTGIKSGIDTLISTIKSGVNSYAIGPLNSALGVINKIPGVSIPTIPALAKGGIVGQGNNGIFANVGEAGPEAVIPLKDSVLSKIGNQILGATGFGNQTTNNNAGNKINVEINVPVGANLSDFKTATEEVLRQLTLEGAL